jgi:hypothetical protein
MTEIFAREQRDAADAAAEQLAAAERRLATLESELLTLRASQVRAATGDQPGTSHLAQANVARLAAAANDPNHDTSAPADGEAAAQPMQNMADLREGLQQAVTDRTDEQLTRFGTALINLLSGQVNQTVNHSLVRDSSRTRPGDIGLSEFSGASSRLATVIEPEYYPRLLLWLEESEHLLRNSGMTTLEQVRTLFANLQGAARKQFTTRWRNLDFHTMTMADAKAKIFALVPNHQTHFSRAALDMTFKANRLASDLDRFALYASHGDLPVDGHHFWYRLIQDKLLDACPDLFRLAAEHFGKRIEFDPNMTFVDMVDKFMDIVLAVQTELKTQLLGKRPLSAPSETGRAAKTPKQTSAAAKPTPKKNDLADNFTLARKVGMCFGCGELYPQGAKGTKFDKTSMISHNKNCRKKFVKGVVTDEFLAAIAKWRNMLESGKSLNDITRAANEMRRK